MEKTLILMLLALVGCSGAPAAQGPVTGPSAQDLEVAYEVAWEGVLAMPQASRPVITWWTPCDPPASPDITTPNAHCWWDIWRPDGTADLRWGWQGPKISDTNIHEVFADEQYWKTATDNTPVNIDKEIPIAQKVRAALLEAGL